MHTVAMNLFACLLVASFSPIYGHGSGHTHLMGCVNPAALGYAELPLNLSYSGVSLAVEGSIPAYVNGTLYRGAPGSWPDGWWLDGLITLNGFKFTEGKVLYTMQWNKDEAYNRTVTGAAPVPSLPAAPYPGAIPHPVNSSWPTGVHFRQVDGHLVGSTGVSNVNEIDFDTLEPLELPFQYDDDLGAPYLAPTHAQMLDGYVLHHLATGMQKASGGVPGYVVTSIKPGSRKRDVIAKIEHPKASSWEGLPSFQHMTLATSEYYIMLETPCFYPDTVTKVGSVDWKGWKSNPLAKTHVRLVSRATGESTIYPLSFSIFAIHHINAYHDVKANTIVLDTIQLFPSFLPCSLAFGQLTMDFERNKCPMPGGGSKPYRLVIPLDKPGAEVVPLRIGNVTGVEFPTIRYDDYNGKPYVYTYMAGVSDSKVADYDVIVKLNVQTGVHTMWHVPGHFPGEPIFVPNPEGTAEDDGVVMTNVLDTVNRQTYVVILDAKTMKEVARAGPTPHVIPHGYHGIYYNRKMNSEKEAPAFPVIV